MIRVVLLMAMLLVCGVSGCSSSRGGAAKVPPGYDLDTTPGNNGEGWR